MGPLQTYLMIIPNLTFTLLPIALLICAILALATPVEGQPGKRPKYATILGWLLILQFLLPKLILYKSTLFTFKDLTILGAILQIGNIVAGVALGVTLLRTHRAALPLSALMFLYYSVNAVIMLIRFGQFPGLLGGLMMLIVPITLGLIWRYTAKLKSKGLLN